MNISTRTETDEGIERRLSINYHSRWRVVNNLGGLLDSAAKRYESARVVSVLEPGYEGPINLDDPDLKHSFSLFNVRRHGIVFNSLAVERFSKLHPQVSFTHANPGAVSTGITRDFPWYIRYPLEPLRFFITTPQDSAEWFHYVAAGSPEYAKGGFILTPSLKDIKADVERKGFLTPELQATVWSHTAALWEEALEKGAKN